MSRRSACLRRLPAVLLPALLGACGASPPPAPADTFAGPQVQALEKARQVQGTVDQHKTDTDAAIAAQDP